MPFQSSRSCVLAEWRRNRCSELPRRIPVTRSTRRDSLYFSGGRFVSIGKTRERPGLLREDSEDRSSSKGSDFKPDAFVNFTSILRRFKKMNRASLYCLLFSPAFIVTANVSVVSAASQKSVQQQSGVVSSISAISQNESILQSSIMSVPSLSAVRESGPSHKLSTDSPILHGMNLYSPIVLASDKIICCVINKIGSTSVLKFLRRALGQSNWIENLRLASLQTMRGLSETTANRMLNGDSWLRIVVIRDPVERFASAFIDKCIEHYRRCPAVVVNRTSTERLELALSALEATARNGTLMNVDVHFRPLVYFCDLPAVLPAFTIVPMAAMEAGWKAALTNHKGVSTERQNELLAIAADIFSFNFSGIETLKAQAINHTTPSRTLVATWRAAAKTGIPQAESKILGRIEQLYAADYMLLEQRLARQMHFPEAAALLGGKWHPV
jgi:hypothetical protein